ncbi:MAG TPA: hypothetical protein VFF06_34830 [Polyangia bacterium]|nr:hypothetical protein [Polyangia bacterium]
MAAIILAFTIAGLLGAMTYDRETSHGQFLPEGFLYGAATGGLGVFLCFAFRRFRRVRWILGLAACAFATTFLGVDVIDERHVELSRVVVYCGSLVVVGALFASAWRLRDRVALAIGEIPGSRLRVWIHFVYCRRTAEHVFDPVLADMQAEWLEATIQSQKWKAAWVRARGYWILGQHICAHLPVSAARAILHLWKTLR